MHAHLLVKKPADKFLEKMLKRAEVLYVRNPNKANLINGIKTAVPFLVPVIMFKYIGAVLATPLADKANTFLVKKGFVNYSNNNSGD